MLTAKAEETSIISSWHYFCASVSSLSVYLTGNDNIYPISELLILRHRAQGTELRAQGKGRSSMMYNSVLRA